MAVSAISLPLFADVSGNLKQFIDNVMDMVCYLPTSKNYF